MDDDLDQLVKLHHVPAIMSSRENLERHLLVCKRCGQWRQFENPMLRACLSKLLLGRCPKFSGGSSVQGQGPE